MADTPRGLDIEEGPLWNTIRRQLYKPEVSYIKRLVGEPLIQQNKLMWDEIASLRQMLQEFQEQNDLLAAGVEKQVQFCDSQHRELLKRQAHIILEDLRSQAAACGHAVEDLVPELRDEVMRRCLFGKEPRGGKAGSKSDLRLSPPPTPSTRPSSSSGYSRCSTPDAATGMPMMVHGRQLAMEELDTVAAGIREALESEHESLLAAISEQMQRFEAEEVRRAEFGSRACRGEASTAQLQQLVHKLQDVAVSPTMRTLALTGSALSEGSFSPPMPIAGGANVRRLQALIANRRRQTSLFAVPEAPDVNLFGTAGAGTTSAGGAKVKAGFDPFFDDPFA